MQLDLPSGITYLYFCYNHMNSEGSGESAKKAQSRPSLRCSPTRYVHNLMYWTIFEQRHVISNKVVFLTSVDSDEHVHPPFKLRNSK